MEKIKNITLTDELKQIIKRIETKADKSIEVRYEDIPNDEGKSLWENDKNPYIVLSEKGTMINVVVHELLHLKIRLDGYPNRFEPKHEIISKLDNFLQHHVIFPQYLKLGYTKEYFTNFKSKNELEQFVDRFLSNKIKLVSRYDFFIVEINAFLAISEFYCFDESVKKKIRDKITWQTSNFWNEWEKITNRVQKSGKEYTKAIRQLCRLFKSPLKPKAIYIN